MPVRVSVRLVAAATRDGYARLSFAFVDPSWHAPSRSFEHAARGEEALAAWKPPGETSWEERPPVLEDGDSGHRLSSSSPAR